MNRKHTILAAVFINAGLLAVLFVAALTMQEEPEPVHPTAALGPELPKFDDVPLYQELSALTPPLAKEEESPLAPIVHRLPEIVTEKLKEEVPLTGAPAVAQVAPLRPLSEVVVKKGDNLEKIARAYQTSVDEIIKLNRLPSSFLKVGQVLKIPGGRPFAKPLVKATDAGPEYYTIKVGENPWAIAMRHHMKLDELLKLNGLNEEKARKLKPGDRLRIK
ncbi:MAG: hypothetical protein A3D96_04130 [Chlamydiae bacterium RIFCSPHIGHO2_12_FULL_44_59]|nr:MAG: hypothetical protein A2796_04445 [Chlamydiae bacterium RIFCSPHIGHO2_01_FULL_44_39]OGN59190.1 MAG: hypothetical protein A3C42_04560 [Chlamydiae bacterium RIFCSPHIGHO2_02_FULL_45_9]OGN60122.1 MAG: hypothetical protein A3D96_04130 [Chlamydiae bacterium RIFCSPHIGHO2_12_FULL_44_59]OGN66279.1 MAG: hypothetical protein A2978_00080 [Chlamydiae bacterium RIFCSPLOWO2_01_FULL_44_52]OGN68927.1 MAG: hypothetical protein A3I67_04060 [Chlamydiae bacterium RIFCSPLOWO2_02_FULL_45_22]OGN70193.1 MAG: hyp